MAKQKKNLKTARLHGTVSDEVGDHSNDPFVLTAAKRVIKEKIKNI